MFDCHALQVFLAAAEHENFSVAGRRMSLSQPAVSMQIRSLEQMVGMELFDRSGPHIRLTDAGQALIPMAIDLIGRAIQVEEALASLRGEVIGLLKVGCGTTVGKYILPKLFAGLRESHPHVQVSCHVTSRSLALQMLLDGEVHAVLTSLHEPYKDVEYHPFVTDQIVLVAPPDHPWSRKGRPIKPAELTQEPIILREENYGTRSALSDALARHDMSLNYLNVVVTLGSEEAISMAVQEGAGLAFVSSVVAAEAIKAGSLVYIEVKGLNLSNTIYMVRHTGRPATRAQNAFWELAFAPENEAIRQRLIPRPPKSLS